MKSYIKSGKVPTNLVYYCKNKIQINDEIEAFPTFVVNAESESMCETAKNWSGAYYHKTDPLPKFEHTNSPIDEIYIIDLHKREQGGRAYKIVYKVGDNWFYVDFREDMLMDVIIKNGIQPGGKVNGSFVWCQFGSQMKLVEHNTDLFKIASDSEETRKIPIIKRKDLVIGNIYTSLSKQQGIFLGNFNVVNAHHERMSSEYKPNTWKKIFDIRLKINNNLMLWLEVPDYIKDLKKFLNEFTSEGKISVFYYKFISSHSYRMDGGNVLRKSKIPLMISRMKSEAERELRNIISQDMDYNIRCERLVSGFCYRSDHISAVEVNGNPLEEINNMMEEVRHFVSKSTTNEMIATLEKK